MNALPGHASVVVIGGGIMGCSNLYHLAKLGVSDAILLERNKLTSGTTWHSAAQVRALRHSRNFTRMIQYSMNLYAQLEQETGQSVGWIQEGSLAIATTPDRLTHVRRQAALTQAFGVEATEVSPGEAQERWPLMNGSDVLGAVWYPDDGRGSPSDVCAALVKAAKGAGAKIFEGTGVTGILAEHGRVKGIETTQGTVMCDAIALCGGLWSRELGAMAGAEVPLWPCEHFCLLTKPVKGITGNTPTLSDHDNHLYIRDDGGGLLVGCFEPIGKAIQPGILDESFEFGLLPEDWDHFEPMMMNALHRLPTLKTAEVKMPLNGPESFTPDGVFMFGETAEMRGLFLGCGMDSVGIASGGGAGMNLAHTIVHGHTTYDLSEADAKRFAPMFNSVKHLMARAPEVLGTHYDIPYTGKQYQTCRDLRRLPLDAEHREAGAHMGQSYGWERPLYFGKTTEPRLTFGRSGWFENVAAEVAAAHERAAIFDSSPLGKIDVTGPDAEAFLLKTCAGHLGRAPGSVVYTALLNERGTFEDGVADCRVPLPAVCRHNVHQVRPDLVQTPLRGVRRYAGGHDRSLRGAGAHGARGKTDLGQGWRAGAERDQLLQACGCACRRQACACGTDVLRRRGRVGSHLPRRRRGPIYAAFAAAGAVPAGLYAQTSMRIEKGFCAMGHELDGDVTPVAAGLDFAVRKCGGFTGANALARARGRRAAACCHCGSGGSRRRAARTRADLSGRRGHRRDQIRGLWLPHRRPAGFRPCPAERERRAGRGHRHCWHARARPHRHRSRIRPRRRAHETQRLSLQIVRVHDMFLFKAGDKR